MPVKLAKLALKYAVLQVKITPSAVGRRTIPLPGGRVANSVGGMARTSAGSAASRSAAHATFVGAGVVVAGIDGGATVVHPATNSRAA